MSDNEEEEVLDLILGEEEEVLAVSIPIITSLMFDTLLTRKTFLFYYFLCFYHVCVGLDEYFPRAKHLQKAVDQGRPVI